jgi:diphthamide synthase subunit DPH2
VSDSNINASYNVGKVLTCTKEICHSSRSRDKGFWMGNGNFHLSIVFHRQDKNTVFQWYQKNNIFKKNHVRCISKRVTYNGVAVKCLCQLVVSSHI